MFENWTNDPDVSKFLAWTAHKSISETENIINLWTTQYNNLSYYNWIIILKEINEPIGSISVVNITDYTECAEVGYCMSKKWWGQGIMTEAFSAVIKYLFENEGFNSIRAWHNVKNPASGRVMVKSGLTFEGILRDYSRSNTGELIDSAFYSILKSEYSTYKKE